MDQKMNKPVALMTEYGIQPLHEGALQEGQFLYTHPVKELTQNIMDIYRLSNQSIQIVFTSCRSASEFEAILRKAQEK